MLLVAVSSIGGCNKGPVTTLKQAPPPQLAPNWKSYDSGHGISMAAPESWGLTKPGALSGMSFGGDLQSGLSVATQEPALSPEVKEEQVKKGILLRLYDRSHRPIPGELIPNVRVKKESTGGMTIDKAADQERKKASPDSDERVELPVGPAHVFRKATTNIAGDVEHSITYIIVDGTNLYRIIFEATGNDQTIKSVAGPMLETFRVQPKS
jgi:hypothetical protein